MKVIKIDPLTRVEGEGGVYVRYSELGVEEAKVFIYEPPRYFEAFLVGKKAEEAVDITARICGICPVAYQISASNAIESLYGVEVHPMVKLLRRLLYLGEYMESHALHIFLLAAPDYLGCASAFEAAKDHLELVRLGLFLKHVGNKLMRVIGGREIHPVNIRIGGLWKAPKREALRALLPELRKAAEGWLDTIQWACSIEYPDFELPRLMVSLDEGEVYGITGGDVITSRGDRFPASDYMNYFEEYQVEYSTALRSRVRKLGEAYMVGPLPRVSNSLNKLKDEVVQRARSLCFKPPVNNPFLSTVARAMEGAHATLEAIELIERYEEPPEAFVSYRPKAGVGYGVSEAPRGILYHMYEVDERGMIRKAVISPPTAQNQAMMERDVTELVKRNLGMPTKSLRKLIEMLIRSYDPCISCSAHSIKVKLEKRPGGR